MYEVERNELLPTRLFAGDYPVVTDVAKVNKSVEKHTVVSLTDTGIEATSAETLKDIYGITADAATAGEEAVIYLTGEFIEEAITFPTGAEKEQAKAPLRRIGIFIK